MWRDTITPMDANELLKAAPEIRNIVGIIVGGIPVAEMIKSIVLPSTEVVGKRMANRVNRFFDKTGTMILDAGVSPQPVSDKIIVDIVRGVSLEDNEDLHTMWAALLANAASAENAGKVKPGFIATLRQLSPDEASLLKRIYDHLQQTHGDDFSFPVPLSWLGRSYTELGFGEVIYQPDGASIELSEFGRCLDSLEASQLIRRRFDLLNVEFSAIYNLPIGEPQYSLTHRGHQFVVVCQPPQPKK